MCQDCQPELQLNQGIDGYNAFTITTANFTMPAENGTVTVNVSNLNQYTGKWGVTGQVAYVYNAGYMQVVSSTNTSLVLRNLKNTGSLLYMGNAAPGTVITTGSKVSPAGLQGPAGNAAKSGQILIDIDYNDYSNTSTSFVTQKTITFTSDMFQSDKDTIELQCNFTNISDNVGSLCRFMLSDGTNTINLLPNGFTGGIDLITGASTDASTFIKLHVSRASSSTVNIMLETFLVLGNISNDLIFTSGSTTPLEFKYKTLGLSTISFTGPLTLDIDTLAADGNTVILNFVKCIKQELI